MLNHVAIMGRLTRDVELRRTDSGIAVASFAIACDRDYSNKTSGEKEVDFFDIVAWRNTAEFVSNYFTKGRMIAISGRLQTRSWTDKDGNKRKTTEVVAESCYFADSKPADGGNTGNGYQQTAPTYAQPAPNYGGQQQQMQQFAGQNYRDGNYGGNAGTYAPPVGANVDDFGRMYGDDPNFPF